MALQISGRHTAAALHTIAASTSDKRSLMPPSSSHSDAIVHLLVKSAGTQPNPHNSTPSAATDVQFSSGLCPQLGSPHKFTATSSGCISSTLPLSSSARKSGRVPAGVGDSLAGFLQEQAKLPHADPQAILPQPTSSSHELFVGMVTADFTFSPSAEQQHCSSSNKPETQHNTRQSPTTSPGCLQPTTASSREAGSVGVSSTRSVGVSGCTEADCKQEQQGAGKAVPQSMEVSVGEGDLTNGAVMLQNPDGSVQYVVLTSDEQRAVQLSMQAKRNKEAATVDTSAYQVSTRAHGARRVRAALPKLVA